MNDYFDGGGMLFLYYLDAGRVEIEVKSYQTPAKIKRTSEVRESIVIISMMLPRYFPGIRKS